MDENSKQDKKKTKDEKSEETEKVMRRIKMAAIFETNAEGASGSRVTESDTKKFQQQKAQKKFAFKRSFSNIEEVPAERKPKYQTNTQKTLRPPLHFVKAKPAANGNVPKIATSNDGKELTTANDNELSLIKRNDSTSGDGEQTSLTPEDELYALESMATNLKELQTDFMRKFAIVQKKFKEDLNYQYKFVTLVRGDTGQLLLKADDNFNIPACLSSLSAGDFEAKLKQSFTDFLTSFVRKTKVYLKVGSKKDFDDLVTLFEAEQEKECLNLLKWLTDHYSSTETAREQKKKICEWEATKVELLVKLKQKDEEIKRLSEQSELREADLIIEHDAQINKMQIDLGKLQKANRAAQQLLETKISELETERQQLLSILEGERRKLVETLEGHREETDIYEKTNQELKQQMGSFEHFLKDVSRMVEEERQNNAALRLELQQSKQIEKDLRTMNKNLNEKLDKELPAQIQQLENELIDSRDQKREMASINSKLLNKIESLEQAKALLASQLEENQIMLRELQIHNEKLALDVQMRSQTNDVYIIQLQKELEETQKHLTDKLLQNQQLKLEHSKLLEDKEIQMQQLKNEIHEANQDLRELEPLKELAEEQDKAINTLQAKLNESQYMNKNLKECNKELTEKLVKVSEEKEYKAKALFECEKQIEFLQSLNENLATKMRDNDDSTTIERLYAELNESENREKNLRKLSAELGDRVRQLDFEKSTAIQCMVKELEASQAGLAELNKLKCSLQEELKKVQEESEKNIQELDKKLDESNQQFEKLRKTNEELINKREELCIKHECLACKLDEREEGLYKLRSQHKRLTKEYEKLNSEKSELGQKLDESQKFVAELQQNLQKLDTDKDSLRTELNEKEHYEKRLRDQHVELTKKIAKLELEKADLLTELNENRDLLKELQDLSTDFESKLLDRNKEVSFMKEKYNNELNDYRERIKELESHNIKMLADIKELSEQKCMAVAKLLNELNETHERIRDLQNANIRMQERLEQHAETEISMEQLLIELDESNDINIKLRAEKESIAHEKQSLAQELESEKEERTEAVRKLKSELDRSRLLAEETERLNDELIEKHKNELKHLKETLDCLQSEFNESQQRVIDLQDLNKNLSEHAKSQFEYQCRDIENLQKSLNETQARVDDLETLNKAIEKEFKATDETQKANILDLQEQLNESQSRVKDLEIVYIELSKKIEDEDRTDTIAEELLSELIESRKHVKELELINEELSRKLQIQEHKVKSSNQDLTMTGFRSERRGMRDLIDDHLQKLCECNSVINKLRESLTQKDEMLGVKSKHNESLRKEIAELVRDLEATKEALITKNKQIRRLESKLNTSVEHFDNLFSTFGHKHAECYEMETKCRVMQDTINRANKIRKSQDETIELLNNKIYQLTTTIQAHQIEIPLETTGGKQHNKKDAATAAEDIGNVIVPPAVPRRHKRPQI